MPQTATHPPERPSGRSLQLILKAGPQKPAEPLPMWEAFLHSINCVLILILLAGAGYWTAHKGWYDQNATALVARLVTFLSLPCYLFSSVMSKLNHDELLALAGSMITPFASIWLCFFVSRIIVRVFKVSSVHSGVFSSAFSATNNMFIGVPVSLALFGEEAIIPTLLYFFANTTFFWTMGNYLEAMDGIAATKQKAPKAFSLATVKRVFSPPLCGFLAAIILILLDMRLPEPVMEAARYMGGITSPLALIFIGIMIYNIGIRNIRITKDLALVLLGRFVICPTVCLAFTAVLPLSPLFAKVYVIQAALPCITQIAVLARFHHADVKFSTMAVASTTLLSVVSLPVWMMILTALE